MVNKNQNICCVGDDDQSIYSWRGAEIKNFLTFDKIYNNCKVFKLDKIIDQQKYFAASTLISNNLIESAKVGGLQQYRETVKLNCYKTEKRRSSRHQ